MILSFIDIVSVPVPSDDHNVGMLSGWMSHSFGAVMSSGMAVVSAGSSRVADDRMMDCKEIRLVIIQG